MIFFMRIDKYLKVSRLIKRREVAKELCDASYILLNGKVAKPSSIVAPGDQMQLRLGRHMILVRVLEISPCANKATASSMYEVLEDRVDERTETC